VIGAVAPITPSQKKHGCAPPFSTAVNNWQRSLLPIGLGSNLPPVGEVFGEEAIVCRLCLWGAEPAKPMFGSVDPDPGMTGARVKPHLRQRMPTIPSHFSPSGETKTGKRDFPVSFSPFSGSSLSTTERRQIQLALIPEGYQPVGATRDVRSLTRQHLREMPEKSTGLCPYPFPFEIWFDGDAVRARSASRRKGGRS